MAMVKPLEELQATDSLDLEYGLSIVPRLKINLSFTRSDLSVKPIDEWQLKLSLTLYLKDHLSITLADGDLILQKFKDLKKRKRDEPVASGVLYLWDLSSVRRELREETRSLETRFCEWKNSIVGKLDGMELNLEGLKMRLTAHVPVSDEFEKMKKAWEDFYGARNRGYISRNALPQPDTLVLEGVPSRWFAEPRVSSKVSVLVTHTIFSKFGRIRNLDVVGSNDLGKAAQEVGVNITSALQCKVWVQYQRYDGFYNAVKALCGRSMLKEGSSLKANYHVGWDEEGYFTETNVRKRAYEKERREEMERRQLAVRAFKSEVVLPQAQLRQLHGERLSGKKPT
eukprot:Gb_16356 [translate_table: standard]